MYECLKFSPEIDIYYESCESYLNLPISDEKPLLTTWLRDTQQGQPSLIDKAKESGTRYHWRDFDGVQLLCYTTKQGEEDTNWKICLSDVELGPAIHWFHQLLNHLGKQKLLQGMNRFYNPDLRKHVDFYKCDA